MANNQSEIEQQRAKILEEIESRASKLSVQQQDGGQPNLNNWLNAAEQIMPETQNTSSDNISLSHPENYSSKVMTSKSSSSVPFFSIIIFLTLFLTIIGVSYIVYSTLNSEIEKVSEYKQQSTQQINDLKESITALEQSIATGGKSELFTGLENEAVDLMSQLASLKSRVEEIESSSSQNMSNGSSSGAVSSNDGVTEQIKQASLELESKLNQKLKQITGLIENNNSQMQSDNKVASSKFMASESPEVKTVAVAEVNQPTIATVSSPETPVVPVLPAVDSKAVSSDVNWLKAEPGSNYILQLASMPELDGAEKVKSKKKLEKAKIIPQNRKGSLTYILVTGSFKDRSDAEKLAKGIKSTLGISPWIRQVEDLTRRIP